MNIIVLPNKHRFAAAIKNRVRKLLSKRPGVSKDALRIKICILKDAKGLNRPLPHLHQIRKLNNEDFKDIQGFSNGAAFRRYFSNFKKAKNRYKYIYLRNNSVSFVNFKPAEEEIVYFGLEPAAGLKGWVKHIAKNINYIYNLRRFSTFYKKSLALHSAGIVKDGKGYLFLGDGGAGKSTVCRLSQGCRILHDDMVKVANNTRPNRFEIYSTDNPLQKAELNNIFFLKKSKKNKLIKLSAAKAIREGLKNTISLRKNFVLSDFSSDTIDFAFDLFRKMDCYRLYFKKDKTFWKLIERL